MHAVSAAVAVASASRSDREYGRSRVVQYIDGKAHVVWPKALQAIDPVLPLPASSPYAAKGVPCSAQSMTPASRHVWSSTNHDVSNWLIASWTSE